MGHSLLPLVLGISFRIWFLCPSDHLCSTENRTLPLVTGPNNNPKNWGKLFSTWNVLYFDCERNLSLMMLIGNQMMYLWNSFLILLVTILLLILIIYMEQFIWNRFWHCTVNNLLICSKYKVWPDLCLWFQGTLKQITVDNLDTYVIKEVCVTF